LSVAEKGKPDDTQRVARHASKAVHFADDDRTILTSEAFRPKDGEDDLSVNWLEYRVGDDEVRIDGVWSDIQSERSIKKKDCLAIVKIDQAKAVGAQMGSVLTVTHEPTNGNESHSAIWGIEQDAKALQQELAELGSQCLIASRIDRRRS
jgi:hypothetical protein